MDPSDARHRRTHHVMLARGGADAAARFGRVGQTFGATTSRTLPLTLPYPPTLTLTPTRNP